MIIDAEYFFRKLRERYAELEPSEQQYVTQRIAEFRQGNRPILRALHTYAAEEFPDAYTLFPQHVHCGIDPQSFTIAHVSIEWIAHGDTTHIVRSTYEQGDCKISLEHLPMVMEPLTDQHVLHRWQVLEDALGTYREDFDVVAWYHKL
jgi:hypothetical protein